MTRTISERRLNPWFRTVIIATAVASVATCIALLFINLTIYRGMWEFVGTGAKIGRVFAGVESLAWILHNAFWVALFASIYRVSKFVRRAASDSLALIGLAVALGTLISWGDDIQRGWLYHAQVSVVRMPVLGAYAGLLMTYPMGLWGWIPYVLFIAPAVVWGVSRYAPIQAPARPAPTADSPDWNALKISVGLILMLISALVIYAMHSPSAGYLMILGALLEGFSYVVIVIALGLTIGGIWGALEWPRRQLAQLIPVLLGVAVFIYGMLRPTYRL